MKKKSVKSTPASGNDAYEKASWVGFFNCRLTEDMKKRITQSYTPERSLHEEITDLARYGYKSTQVWDEQRNTWHVSATGAWKGCVNAGYTLTAEHADLGKAMFILWFLIVEIYNRDKWPIGETDYPGNDW